MNWIFELDDLVIEEPLGFSDIVFKVMRDDTWHGVMFEASTSSLKFYGVAFDYLKAAKESYGVDATVIFTASVVCDEDSTAYVSSISGKLNFAQYSETCGRTCLISLPVEQADCTMILKNRFDQKVSVDNNVSIGGVILENYNGLGFTMDLQAQEMPISADASVLTADGGTIPVIGSYTSLIRPVYATVRDNSIATGQLNDPASFYGQSSAAFEPFGIAISPQVLLEEPEDCISTDWTYDVRMKGTIRITTTSGAPALGGFIQFGYWNGLTSNPFDELIPIEPYFTINGSMTSGVTYAFDRHYTGTVTLPEGVGIYFNLVARVLGGDADVLYNFEPETSFLLSNTKNCPPTDCKVYLVNETLGRVTEAITDRCLTVQSDYYGRTDSQPYTSTTDGCGALRILTSGLLIRQATGKDFFLSLKDLLTGLKAIDNIGFGIETDRLRIEPVEYFYQNTPLLTIDLIPEAESKLNENLVFSIIKVGYNKWEIKSVKGIDEFNSLKEFHTGLKSVSRTLDISTDIITSGYIIETLRSSTLAVSGNADSTYDNDTFLICVSRDGGAYYDYVVEQGVIDNPANMFSPTTAYNWRIRPMYNLMRWAKSIFNSYAILANTTSKIFFSSGTGNYLAEGNLNVSDDCRLENKVLAENVNLTINDFDDPLVPIWKPETIEFDYPLSIRDYNLIKANPYGYINIQCGQGLFEKAFIKSVDYKPSTGEATFNLLLKWP